MPNIKKRKRTKRIKASAVVIETPAQQRESLPGSLVKAFVAVSSDRWENETLYNKYKKEALKYLGKEKIEDPIESGRLVVRLAKATSDIVEKKINETQAKTKKKATRKKAKKSARS